jgi:hypothetical protein
MSSYNYENSLFDSAFITEPASTYYFHQDYQNNQYVIMPLFVKTALTDLASTIVISVQQVMLFFANLLTLVTFTGDKLFTSIVDTTIYAAAYIVKTALTPMYAYLQRTYLKNITSLDKFMIGAFFLYLLIQYLPSVFNQNNNNNNNNNQNLNQVLIDKITFLEKQMATLKRNDKQQKDELEVLVAELENTILNKVSNKFTVNEARLQKKVLKMQKQFSQYM